MKRRTAMLRLLVVGAALHSLAGFARAQSSTSAPELTAAAPIKNFRLPTFTREGFRDTMLRGNEARILNRTDFMLIDMTLTLFSGDASDRVETVLVSPEATAFTARKIVQGTQSVRLIRDDIEVTGENWSYDHTAQKVTIGKRARVVFRMELKDVIK